MLAPDFGPRSFLLDKKWGFVTAPLFWYPEVLLIAVRPFIWLGAFRCACLRQRSEQNLCWRDLRLTPRPHAWQRNVSNRLVTVRPTEKYPYEPASGWLLPKLVIAMGAPMIKCHADTTPAGRGFRSGDARD